MKNIRIKLIQRAPLFYKNLDFVLSHPTKFAYLFPNHVCSLIMQTLKDKWSGISLT